MFIHSYKKCWYQNRKQIICGSDNGSIKLYQNDMLLAEFLENSAVVQLSRIGMFAFFHLIRRFIEIKSNFHFIRLE